ncbi:hypothetical protein Poli38472_013800 [Pythium oligandrum]|uniref:Little elongation complex subunit 2 C-terminal domain-containing protein n=1 Tax=Pythium oligandrum TaxID=41045 RepID=A0A8K1C251_PYTOL|nr:hypothetical protein Poli38472_013800 [Pythium oligandrum]|eukprot:TMW55038.1 hypothetical protein Poli38472_013800 [Pythium oligandrum]
MENAFAVPPRLVTRKRRAVDAEKDARAFLKEEVYRAYSVEGEIHESGVYADEEARRMVVVTAKTAKDGVARSGGRKRPQHLALMLLEQKKKEKSQLMALVDNIARRLSSLTVVEHVEYLRLQQKRLQAQRGGLPVILALTSEEAAEFARLNRMVQEEQAIFCDHFEKLALKESRQEYVYLPSSAAEWHEQMMQTCRNTVSYLYPRYFQTHMSVSLDPSGGAASTGSTRLVHIQEVETHGHGLIIDNSKLVDGVVIDMSVFDELQRMKWNAISADLMAEKLMEKYDCDVAISSSTLLKLFDTSLETQWLIPVKSRACVTRGKAKKQLYFDCPLPSHAMTAREKISCAFRDAAVHALQETAGNSEVPLREHQGCVSYRIWQIGDVKMLVRTTTNAFIRQADSPEKTTPVSLFIKPDAQPLGLKERLSRSERRRYWLHSWIRGGSTILIGHLDPRASEIFAWEKHSLASIAGAHEDAGMLEAFDPAEHFTIVSTTVSALQSVSIGTYVIRSRAVPKERFCQMDVLTVLEQDGEAQLDVTTYIEKAGRPNNDKVDYELPKWPHVPNRIPFTFRTGTYCQEYFEDGHCPRVLEGEKCDFFHMVWVPSKTGVSWTFEDHTNVVRHVKDISVPGNRPVLPRLKPTFPFCRGVRVVNLANMDAVLLCPKAKTCELRHVSLHEIAERLADEALRNQRTKRRSSKAKNRAKRGGRQ